MDVYSGVIVGWRLSNSLCKEAALEALEEAIWHCGIPFIINSDQGTQFTSEEWEKLCRVSHIPTDPTTTATSLLFNKLR